jgi:hypothetical protein
MHYLAVTLHLLGVRLAETAQQKTTRDPDRGSVTIEQVMWAVALIAIVGIVVVAIRGFVTAQAAKIQ